MSAIAEEIRDELSEMNDEALVWDGFDEALIGYGQRCGLEAVAIYDYEKMIEILMKDMTVDEAREYFEYNIAGAFIGEYTPIIVNVMRRDMSEEVSF
jgi:hypothetical protein